MRSVALAAVVATVVAGMVLVARAQNAQAPATTQGQAAQPAQGRGRGAAADPYANNAAPGTQTFPLAAKAGVDSNARMVAPMGAVNQGPFDPAGWKYGTAWDAPPGSKIWNPVKIKMMQVGKVTGGTFFGAGDASTYCAMANAGYDFIWTEMQHDQRDWETAARIWKTCPHAKAVPGVRVAYTDERGGYRNTINDNIVLILMIETLEGLKNSDAIAKVPGVTALFAASGDLGNFSGYRQGTPDYERAINIVHDSTLKAGIRLCGPMAWRDRPDFTCFQAQSETAAISRGVAAELGPLA